MVQIHTMGHTPTFGEQLGAGIKSGIGLMVQDMMRQKEINRELEATRTRNREFAQGAMGLFANAPAEAKPKIQAMLESYGPQLSMEMLKSFGPDFIAQQFGVAEPTGSMNIPSAGAKAVRERPINELIPYEDREAIEEEELIPKTSGQVQKQLNKPPEQQPRILSPLSLPSEYMQLSDPEFEKAISRLPLTAQKSMRDARIRQQTYNLAVQKEQNKQTERAEKRALTSKEYISNLREKSNNANKKKSGLETIIKLSKEEGNATKIKALLANKLGIDEAALFNANEDTIAKLTSEILPTYLREYPTGRILATEVSSALKALPTIMQTAGGRIKIANFMLKLNEIPKLEYEIANKIKNEYKKRGEQLPDKFDFEDQIAEQMQEKLDDIHKEAAAILMKPSEKLMTNEPNPEGLPTNPHKGMRIRDEVTNQKFRFNGSKWEAE